jgi:hypothetical protein
VFHSFAGGLDVKVVYCTLGAGLLAAFCVSGQAEEVVQPASVTLYELGAFAEPSASPSDVVVKKAEPPASPGAGTSCCPGACEGGALGSGCCCGCRPGDPWTLPQPCALQCMGIKLGGWLQQGITFNADNVADGFNGPVATNDWDHEYQMNQLWLYLDRPADNGGCGWAWGGHFDILFGTDWRFGINHGLEDRINGFHDQSYGTVIPQMYLEFAYDNLKVKLGHFAGILDYEVVPGPPNPFYSHSYSYGYTVPQLVTGVLADYRLSPCLSLLAGFHRGWMQFEDYNDDLAFMGGVKWESCDKRSSIAYAISTGRESVPLEDDNRFVYSLVAQRQLSERLRYVLVHNLGVETGVLPDGGDAEWYGLNQYFLYQINPCWAANLRIEWLRDDDGVRIAGPGNIPGVRAWEGAGYAGNFYELTCGLTWRPTANLMFRPEVRWDWYDGRESTKAGFELPFNDGASSHQFLFAVDSVITF